MRNLLALSRSWTVLSFALSILTFNALAAAPNPPGPLSITSFKIEVQYNAGKITDDIIADIYGDSLIVAIIPSHLADLNLKATFATEAGVAVMVNNIDQQSTITSNDFSSPVTYVVSSGGTSKKYRVRLVATGLPLVYVYTDGGVPIENKEDYVDATIKIVSNEAGVAPFTSVTEIRGRGNSTWTFPKKPYRLKLAAAASVLGMPADKDWVLLANFADKTLMRNTLALDMGREMNFAWIPGMKAVDLVLNGVYQGSYNLGEHVKVDKDRVNIKELDEEDVEPDKITGGYFIELDNYRDGVYFTTDSGLPFVMKSPDEPVEAQYGYIHEYFKSTEGSIFSPDFADPVNGYNKYIDPETFIEWYWVSEIFKNLDAKDGSSIFYYKDRDQKLKMGPLWDFDVAAGNVDINGAEIATGFYIRESLWFNRLFQDPAFKSAAEARWATLKTELLNNLPAVIDQYAAKLEKSQQLNFYKWDILNKYTWPSPLVLGSYQGEVDYLKKWLMNRIAWIDSQINQPEVAAFTLTAPSNESRYVVSHLDESRITFSWKPSSPGSTYTVLMDEAGGDFSDELGTYNANFFKLDTTAMVPVAALYDYLHMSNKDSVTIQWTVSASLGNNTSMAAEPFKITLVSNIMGVPKLISPAANGMSGVTPTLVWHRAHLAQNYDLQVSTDDTFSSLIVDETGLTDTTFTVGATLSEAPHYWRIRSVSGQEKSAWSEVRSFTPSVVTAVGDVAYGVSMFPNPTSKELFIEIPEATLIEHAELVDALGRTAASSGLLPGVTTKIDVSNLQRGMYIVILRGKADKPVTSKVFLR